MGDLPNLREERLIHFLNSFTTNARDDNFLVVKYGNYTITEYEFDGEVINWILQYLQYMSCPTDLEKCLARKILQDIRVQLLSPSDEIDSQSPKSRVFPSLQLLQNVTNTVNSVCKQILNDQTCLSHLASLQDTNSDKKWSICSQKNGRRKMEDRHVLIPDLKDFLPTDLQARLSDDDPVSYYAVFDGHAGTDAAAYATSHLHEQLVQSKHFPQDMQLAFRDAFIQTDQKFIDKKLKSGTTAICTLIKGNNLYFSWLGDSQAILVRNGKAVKVVDPHKPDRSDEKARIEALGGAVMYWGTWRVNGQLAVSRAIGDGEYKPFVSAEPDVTTVEVDGSEDFIIIGCDGLWDTLSPEEATRITFQEIHRDSKNIEGISTKLATAAKEAGSGDNISIIVIFLKSPEELAGTNHTCHKADPSLSTGISSTSSFVLNNMNGDDKLDHLDGLTSPNISLNPFSSPSGGMTFSPDPFGATNGTNGNGIHADSASDASDQESLGHMEEFGLMSVEQLKATTKPESPGIFSSQSVSPSPDADLRPDLGGETLAQLAGQHKGGDSGFISPAGAANSQPDGYSRDTEPDGDGSQLSHGSIHLMDDLLQMSAQQGNDDQLDMDDQQGEDTKSLEEILAERRDEPEGCENMEESEEDEDDSDSDEEIGEFAFIRTEGGGQLEHPPSQLECEVKPMSMDENIQKDEVDLCSFLGTSAPEQIKEEKITKEVEESSDSETEIEKKNAPSLIFSETEDNQEVYTHNKESKHEFEKCDEESEKFVLQTAESNAIEDECLREVETLVPTIKTNAIDDAGQLQHVEEESALSSLESQGSAPSSLESQPHNGFNIEPHNDVWSQQLQSDTKEISDDEAMKVNTPENTFDMDSFNPVAGGPDRVIVACMDGPEESGCLVPQGREMPSPQEAVLAVIDNGMSAVPEDSEDGKENGIDHTIDTALISMDGHEESNCLLTDERETPSNGQAPFVDDNELSGAAVVDDLNGKPDIAISSSPAFDNDPCRSLSPMDKEVSTLQESPVEKEILSPLEDLTKAEVPSPQEDPARIEVATVVEDPFLVTDESPMFSHKEANFTNEEVTMNTVSLTEDSNEKKDLVTEHNLINSAPEMLVNGEDDHHSEPEPEASVDSDDLVDVVGHSEISFENDNAVNPLVLKTPQENVMEEVKQSPLAETNTLDLVTNDNVSMNLPDTDPCDEVAVASGVNIDMAVPAVKVDTISTPQVNLSGTDEAEVSIPNVNLSAISVPEENLSAMSIPDVNLSAMSSPGAEAGATNQTDANLDTINVPDVNVIPATPTRTKSPSVQGKQAQEKGSDTAAKEKNSKDGNKTTSKGPIASKAPTSKMQSSTAKRPSPAKPAGSASKTAGVKPAGTGPKPATKPTSTASKTAQRPAPASPRTATSAPKPSTAMAKAKPTATAAKSTIAPRPTSTATKTATTTSRPTTATSRATAASSRPSTAPSRPATASSRPATGSSRPATASARPAPPSSRPASGSSRPATSRPTTATSRAAAPPKTTSSTSRPASARPTPTPARNTAAAKPSTAPVPSAKVPPIRRPTGPSKPLTNGAKAPAERPATKPGAAKPSPRPTTRPATGSTAPKAAPAASKTRVPPTGARPAGAAPIRRVPPKAGETSKASPTKPAPSKSGVAKKLPPNKVTAKPKTSAVEPETSLDSQVLTNGDASHDEAEAHLEMNGHVEEVNAHLENGVVHENGDHLESLNGINGTTEPISIQNE